MKTIVMLATSLSGSCQSEMFPPFHLLLHCHQPQWHERGNQLPGSSSHQRINLTKRLEDNHQEERAGGIKILWRIHRQKHKEKQHARVSVEASMLYMLMTARYFRFGGQYSQTGISRPRKPTYISLFNAYTFWIARTYKDPGKQYCWFHRHFSNSQRPPVMTKLLVSKKFAVTVHEWTFKSRNNRKQWD